MALIVPLELDDYSDVQNQLSSLVSTIPAPGTFEYRSSPTLTIPGIEAVLVAILPLLVLIWNFRLIFIVE